MRISDWSSDVCSSDLGIEPSQLRQGRTACDGGGFFGERAAEPDADRGDEAHLAAVEDFVGKVAAHRALHQPFAGAAPKAHVRWHPCGEFNEAVIQKRLARFQADGHACSVDLCEDVARPPYLETVGEASVR